MPDRKQRIRLAPVYFVLDPDFAAGHILHMPARRKMLAEN
jgi:hypothetical protein